MLSIEEKRQAVMQTLDKLRRSQNLRMHDGFYVKLKNVAANSGVNVQFISRTLAQLHEEGSLFLIHKNRLSNFVTFTEKGVRQYLADLEVGSEINLTPTPAPASTPADSAPDEHDLSNGRWVYPHRSTGSGCTLAIPTKSFYQFNSVQEAARHARNEKGYKTVRQRQLEKSMKEKGGFRDAVFKA